MSKHSSESARDPIRLEMKDKIKLAFCGIPVSVATTNDLLYMHCSYRDDFINVFDRSNLHEVKHVIQTRDYDLHPKAIAACNQSTCVYLLSLKGKKLDINSVERITKDDEHQFQISPWISELPSKHEYNMAVSANGSLILSRTERPDEVISIYKMDGSLQQQLRLPLDLFFVSRIIPTSSGNLVFVSLNYEFKKQLTETDMGGKIAKQYQSSLLAHDAGYADSNGRLLIADRNNKLELLDSEFKPLDVTLPTEEPDNLWAHPILLHYDELRSEVLVIEFKFGVGANLSVFTFREDR